MMLTDSLAHGVAESVLSQYVDRPLPPMMDGRMLVKDPPSNGVAGKDPLVAPVWICFMSVLLSFLKMLELKVPLRLLANGGNQKIIDEQLPHIALLDLGDGRIA